MRVRAELRGGLRVGLRAAQGGAPSPGRCGVVPGEGAAGGCMPPASATAVRARVRVRVRARVRVRVSHLRVVQ